MYERHQRVSTFLQVELYTSNKVISAEAGAEGVLQKMGLKACNFIKREFNAGVLL